MKLMISKMAWLCLLTTFATAALAEPTVGFSASRIKAGVGETITIQIVMSDFPTTEGGGLTLRFNPSVVRVVDVEIDSATWNFVTRDGVIDNDKGRVKDLLFSSFSGVAGDAVVATVTLETLGRGRSRLKLVESGLNPFGSGGNSLDVAIIKSVVSVR